MKVRLWMKSCSFIFGLFLLNTLQAADSKDNIRSALSKQFPNIQIDEINPSPVPELIQVTAGPNIIYVTKDARYVLAGDMIDLQNKQTNLTEDLRKKVRLKSLGDQSENSILFAPKDPKYTVTVYTDIDCGYCRKLHSEIKKLNDLGIAIRYLAFPRGGPDSDTFEKMVKIWCAQDKQKAFTQAIEGKSLNEKTCSNNSVMTELEQGIQMGVNGTPTLIFEDGTIVPGYLPPEKMLELAKKLKK